MTTKKLCLVIMMILLAVMTNLNCTPLSTLPSEGIKLPQEEGKLIANIEGRWVKAQEGSHWESLGSLQSESELELRGTESQNRSKVPIVRYEWDFGDGEVTEGEYAHQ